MMVALAELGPVMSGKHIYVYRSYVPIKLTASRSFCGETWYTQTQTAGQNKDGSPYIPACTWFDANHDAGQHASMKWRTRAYGATVSEAIANNHVCQSTIYGVDDAPVDGTPAKLKRDTSVRPKRMTDQLIVSSFEQHSAKELCNSETSWGPDFIDSHGQYCDMGTKTLENMCQDGNFLDCVALVDGIVHKRAVVAGREVHINKKTYEKVVHW